MILGFTTSIYLTLFFLYGGLSEDVLFQYFMMELCLNFTVAIIIAFLSVWKLSNKKIFLAVPTIGITVVATTFYFQFILSQIDYLSFTSILIFGGVVLNKVLFYLQYKEEAVVWALFYLFVGMAILLPSFLFVTYVFNVWGALYFGAFNIYMLYAKKYSKWPHSKRLIGA